MRKIKRIAFLQLPLLNHTNDYILGNIEYASAAIAGYLRRNVDSACEVYLLPFELSNFGSNQSIAAYLEAMKPDIIAFTCYLWNIERNLAIAQILKQRIPTATVVMGGVEINSGSIATKTRQEAVDYFVIGEGEWFFRLLLSGASLEQYASHVEGNDVIVQPPDGLIPAGSIFEPFTENQLRPMPDGSVFFELSRGCPYSCSYCLYSKNFHGVREVPYDTLYEAVVHCARKLSVSEIYIMSPALTCSSRFRRLLVRLAEAGHGVRLHAEMRAEGIDADMAGILYRAGFRSMEVGLQTLTVGALRSVRRMEEPELALKGMEHLKKAGIDIKIGVIPGLPGERRDTFLYTIRRLVDFGFADNIELYPLMILPGTAIREAAERDSIEFGAKPPYYYHDGWGVSFNDIRELTAMVEELTGYSHVIKKLPDFTAQDNGTLCGGVRFSGDDESSWDLNRFMSVRGTAVFSLHISLSHPAAAVRGLKRLMETVVPDDMLNIIIYCDDILEERSMLECVYDHDTDSLLKRLYVFHDWKDGFGIRLFQVINDYDRYARAMRGYEWIVPIMRINPSNYSCLERISTYDDNVLLARGVMTFIRPHLYKFHDALESLAFEDRADQEDLYRILGQDYVRFPCSFTVKNG